MDSVRLSSLPALSVQDFPPFAIRAPWWGGDLQTMRNFLVRRRAPLPMPERLFLPMRDGSGDRLVGSLHRPIAPPATPRPLIVLIHGLSGCEDSFYIRKTAAYLLSLGFAVLRLNLRGAGASRPSCRFQYYAGRSEDFADALAALPRELTDGGVVAIGYSLGDGRMKPYIVEAKTTWTANGQERSLSQVRKQAGVYTYATDTNDAVASSFGFDGHGFWNADYNGDVWLDIGYNRPFDVTSSVIDAEAFDASLNPFAGNLPEIDIGPFKFFGLEADAMLGFAGFSSSKLMQGLVGYQVLRRFNLTFDYRSTKVFMSLNENGSKTHFN